MSYRFLLVVLVALLAGPVHAQDVPQQSIFPELSGQALLDSLQQAYRPAQTLGYDRARDTLYRHLDATYGGLRGVYTGYTIVLAPGADPSADAAQKGVNAEHTYPQSMGAGDEPARSDLHNLFPTKSNVNSSRGNAPYAEIPDFETDTWYCEDYSTHSVPDAGVECYSEYDGHHPSPAYSRRFEPREDHKGNAARAVLYFYTVYQDRADAGFFAVQRDDLLRWHRQDEVDRPEHDRSAFIASHQGTHNPFILDTTLVRRAFGEPAALSPTVRFTAAEVTAGEGGGSVTLTVELAEPDGEAMAVDVAFDAAASSATTADVGGFAPVTVTFPAGAADGATRDVQVDLTDDDEVEGQERAVFTLTNLQTDGAALLGSPQQVSLILDDDEAGSGVPPGALIITEFMANPSAVSDSDGEYVELYNDTAQPIDIEGFVFGDDDLDSHTIASGGALTVPAGGFLVLAAGSDPLGDGSLTPGYVFSGIAIANGGDELVLSTPEGVEVARLAYADGDGAGPGVALELAEMAAGRDGVTEQDDYRGATGQLVNGDYGSPGTLGGTSLPVELTGFEAVADGPDVVLTWSTASETSNAGFYLQHESDLDSAFSDVAFVEGHGTTTEPRTYQYRLDDFAPGTHRFRLQQVDLDGASTYSSVVEVRVKGTTAIGAESEYGVRVLPVYPNPARGRAFVTVEAHRALSHADLVVYDVLGRHVEVLHSGALPVGRHRFVLDGRRLSPGAYAVRFTGGSARQVQLVTVVE